MIAGLPQAPSSQNPLANPLAAKKRRNHVLERLYEEKYITEAQFHEATQEPLTATYHGAKLDLEAPYVAEMIRQSLYDHFGADAYTKGYKVFTTIQSDFQKAANLVVEENLINYDKRHGYRGPVAHIEQTESKPTTELIQSLKKFPVIGDLMPGVIQEVKFREVICLTREGEVITIPWQGLSWARKALRKGWVGKAPNEAQDVVSAGDIVYLRKQNGQWRLTQIPSVEAALVALNPKNGAIEALVGGFNFQRSKYNRATQSSRQPGSCFKPFVYAAALNKGYTLSTMVNDAPIVVDDPSQPDLWRPQNANREFNGPMRLKEGLIRSRNMVSIRILDDIGIQYAIDFVSRFGFPKASLPHGLSLALGSLSATPLELAAAYAVFANGGFKVEPFLIDRITDENDQILLQAKPVIACDASCSEEKVDPDLIAPRIIPKDIAFLMDSALKDVVQHGTARGAKVLDRKDIAGKTGTTNDQIDTWFAGYQKDLVVTTWVGFDNPKSLHEYAARLALPMWVDFMRIALKNKPEETVPVPENIIALHINPKTGVLAPESQANSVVEYFREEDVPVSDDSSNSNRYDTEAMDSQDHLF